MLIKDPKVMLIESTSMKNPISIIWMKICIVANA